MSSLRTSFLKTESPDKEIDPVKPTTVNQNDKLEVKNTASSSAATRTSKKRTVDEAGFSSDPDIVEDDDEGYDADSDNDMSDWEHEYDSDLDERDFVAATQAWTISAEEAEDVEMLEAGEVEDDDLSGFKNEKPTKNDGPAREEDN